MRAVKSVDFAPRADYNYGRCAPLFWQIAFLLPSSGKFSPRRGKEGARGCWFHYTRFIGLLHLKQNRSSQARFKPELRSKHQLQNVDVMLRVYIIFSGGAQIREWQKSGIFTQIIALCFSARGHQKSPTCACVCAEDPLAMYPCIAMIIIEHVTRIN
jgi:hypothetical protein